MASSFTVCKCCNARDGPWHDRLSFDLCPLCECDPHFFDDCTEPENLGVNDEAFAAAYKSARVASIAQAGVAASEQGEVVEQNGVTFEFEPKPEGFAPVYSADPQHFVASTNAGDYRLYVGGGAINAAFLSLLKQEQGLQCGKRSEDYVKLHCSLLNASRTAGKLVAASDVPDTRALLDKLRLTASFGQAGRDLKGDCVGFEGCNASVFIDVFEANARPLNEKNVAMLYVVGPKGEGCKGPKGEDSGPLLNKEDFLTTVEALGRQALEAVAHYNNTWASPTCARTQLPKIEEVRWCLVSGGVYIHADATKVEVAKATLNGMMSAACANLKVTFAYDEDSFLRAYKGDLDAEESTTTDILDDSSLQAPMVRPPVPMHMELKQSAHIDGCGRPFVGAAI